MLWLLCCVLCCAAMRQWNSSLSVRGGGSCQAERLLHISFEYYTAYTLEVLLDVRNRRSQPVRVLGLCLQHAALLVLKAAPHLFGFHVECQLNAVCIHPVSLRFILILSFHLRIDLQSRLFPSDFVTETVCISFCTMRATCPTHLIFIDSSIIHRALLYVLVSWTYSSQQPVFRQVRHRDLHPYRSVLAVGLEAKIGCGQIS
jgi:hypothetical protein